MWDVKMTDVKIKIHVNLFKRIPLPKKCDGSDGLPSDGLTKISCTSWNELLVLFYYQKQLIFMNKLFN